VNFFNLFLASFLLIVVSCGNNSETIENPQEILDSSTLFGDANFVFPSLSENAKTYITQWGAFEDFETEAKRINGNTIEALRDKTERLISRIDSLTKKVPDTLQTNAIVSRVMVAKTRAHLLYQEVRKMQIDSGKLQQQIFEMNRATKNLLIQINEKFQKDAIDFQRKDDEKKEIEKQKRFLDSVYKTELQDTKVKNVTTSV
jgi:predicted  nucleic acid-binding Zn-ribbon protein